MTDDQTGASANADDQSSTDSAADTSSTTDRMFGQAELDRIVQDRLARQRAQFANYDELKQKASQFDELEKASQTELEKAQTRAAELEKQLADATTQSRENLLRAAVVSEAAKKNVVDPDAALKLLDRSTLTFADDGTPENISDALDQLITAKPYLAGGKPTGAGPADLGARGHAAPGQLSRDDLKAMSAEEIAKATAEGRLTNVLSGG